jgi:hypothetical protein
VIETFGAHLAQSYTALWDGVMVGKGQLDFVKQLQLCLGGMLATGVDDPAAAGGGPKGDPKQGPKKEEPPKKEEKKVAKKTGGGVSQMYSGSKAPMPPAAAAATAAPAAPKTEVKKKKQDKFPCPPVEDAKAKLKLFLDYPRTAGTFFTAMWQVCRLLMWWRVHGR